MADQDDGVQLFGQCKICIVCSKDLDESAADKVCIYIPDDIADLWFCSFAY